MFSGGLSDRSCWAELKYARILDVMKWGIGAVAFQSSEKLNLQYLA
mgnify:CR=1 FL=1